MRRLLIAGLALSAAAALAIGVAAAADKGKAALDDKAFGEKVRAYLIAHPEVLEEAMAALKVKQDEKAEASLQQGIAAHREELEHARNDYAAGTGPVTVVEFFDYRCPYCKVAAPQLPDFIKAHKEIRLVFKEFPILSETSTHAAKAAIAARNQGKYMPVHLALMSAKDLNDESIDKILIENGVDLQKAKADEAAEATSKEIDQVHALAEALGVDGTPAFVVGGKMIAGWQPDALAAAIKADGKDHDVARAK